MTITQTVEIPANRRLTIEVPPQIPVGRVILTFTPATDTVHEPSAMQRFAPPECPECARHWNPETGELRFNAETIAAFEEGDAMLRGEIPAKRFNSLAEMLEDLERDDQDD